MRRSIVIIVLVMLFTLTLFSAWLVQFYSSFIETARSGQLSNIKGTVEYQIGNQPWLPATNGLRVTPKANLRLGEDGTASLKLNQLSQLGLQANSQLNYQGFSAGAPTWNLLTGAISGRYYGEPEHPLKIRVGTNVVAVTNATFELRNNLNEQSLTVFDQSVTISANTSGDAAEMPAKIVKAGETYSFTAAIAVENDGGSSTPTPTVAEQVVVQTLTPLDATTAAVLAMPKTSPLSLTIGKTTPKITFIWIDPNQPTDTTATKPKVSYRLLRGTSEPLDQTTAVASRTITNKTSFDWALPDKKHSYHFRVCIIEKNNCTVYSNTLTFLPEN